MTIINRIDDRLVSQFRINLNSVQKRITQAAERVHRDPAEIRLVVVSKFQPVNVIACAIQAGVKNLGENYAEQAVPKIEALRDFPEIQWHMVGHIQSRKARIVCEYFHFVHSLDSLKLAEKLENACQELDRTLPVLLEVNLGGEETKSGWNIPEYELDGEFITDIGNILQLSHLKMRGLMTMPPIAPDPELSRPFFRKLANLRLALQDKFPQVDWLELSIGTSADFPIAVEEGATMVQIGQAILGPRPKKSAVIDEQSNREGDVT